MAEDEKRRQEKLSEEDLGKVFGGKGSQDEVEQAAPIDDEDEDISLGNPHKRRFKKSKAGK